MEAKGTVNRTKFVRLPDGTSWGTVVLLVPGIDVGGGMFIPAHEEEFILYFDEATMIDPTEMVRRNWFIGQIQQAVAHKLQVTITTDSLPDARVIHITLHASE